MLGKDYQDTKRVSNRLFKGEVLPERGGGSQTPTRQVEEARTRTVLEADYMFVVRDGQVDGWGFG